MKLFRFFASILTFTLAFTFLTFAQTEKTQTVNPNKIAIVNSMLFTDEKDGIYKLAQAEKLMGMTDCAAFEKYYSTLKEIEQLKKEVAILEYQKLSITDKLDQLEKVKDENSRARIEDEACRRKIRSQSVDPIIESVRKKLEEFAKQKGYRVVISADQDTSFLIIDAEYTNITSEFIKFCNDAFDKEKSQ